MNLPKSSAETTIGKIADIGMFIILVGGFYAVGIAFILGAVIAVVCGILESVFGIPTFMSNTY